ncbi:MAG: alpha-L-arabinofuranosidase C-terminal domain-containing protein [Ignavibacteria bacterium]|jgi:alpha-L-arabinofuranosidase
MKAYVMINRADKIFMKKYIQFTIKAFMFFFLSAFFSETAVAQTDHGGKKISSNLFGLFFEDINYAADGGLYAELIQNRSFEYTPNDRREWNPFSYWEYITPGFSYGRISVETASPIHPNNPHYIVLDVEHVGHEAKYKGNTGVGLKNTGFNGIVINAGDKYNLSFFARMFSDNPVTLTVGLHSPSGKIKYAEDTLTVSSKDWKKYTTSFTVKENSDSATFVLMATTHGKLALDVVSLFPGKTFKNRPNGLRADLAQMLADMKPKFIRFPGGCLVHGDGLGNMYRWKNTIGPIEERKGQRNIWNYHQTAGLGYFEYFQFCEDIGAKPLPVLPAAVCCQNSGGTWRIGGTGQREMPLSELDNYIQEILDLIEYANGPTASTWGTKRAEAGHPEPFNLEYIGIGNEDKITPVFTERFKLIYEAVREKHPEIKIIGTVGPFQAGEDFDKGWAFADELRIDMVDEHFYENPEWFITNQERYDEYDRTKSEVYLGEYASWGNTLYNALAEATFMTSLERNGDIVKFASYAPLLAKKGHTQWKTDLIFFDNTTIYPSINYYIQKLFSTNQGDVYHPNIVTFPGQTEKLAASCVEESNSGDIILKLVNVDSLDHTLKIDLSRFDKINLSASLTELKGNPDDENTFENPVCVVPVQTEIKMEKIFDYKMRPYSFIVIRMRTN